MATDPKTLAYRKANNLCPRDGRPNKTGRKMCEYCLKKSAEKTERHRQKKKAKGLCLSCGKKVDNTKFCDKCKKNVAVTLHNSHIKRYNTRKLMNKCTACGDNVEDGIVSCRKCLDKQAIRQKNIRDNNLNAHRCSQCGNDLDGMKGKRCQTCIDKRNSWYQGSTTQSKDKVRRDENREAVIQHYGGKCVECEESRPTCLAIDHIEGGGNTHRRKIGKWGSGFFKWLVDNNFPEGFQILCHNCNMGKHLNGGKCPHKWRNGRPVITREMRKNLPCPFPKSEEQL
jgi:hypothetical protein